MCVCMGQRDSPPLSEVDWFNDPGYFVDKGDSSSDVVEHRHISDLLPWHWHVLKQLQHGMGHVLECPETRQDNSNIHTLTCYSEKCEIALPEVHSLVISKLSVCHVTVISNNLPDVLWRHIFLLSLHEAKLSLLAVALRLKLLPFSSCRERSVSQSATDTAHVATSLCLSYLFPEAFHQREVLRAGKDGAAVPTKAGE